MLQHLELACPNLRSVDATFCTQLTDKVLSGALAGCPPLERLTLSVCACMSTSGLARLGPLARLRLLDLSYTEVETLDSVLGTCPNLEVLNLANCRCLEPTALAALLPYPAAGPDAAPLGPGSSMGVALARGGGVLPRLRELDVSYCPLPTSELQRILQRGAGLEVLAINGCPGVTDGLWAHVNALPGEPAAEPSAPLSLRSLSCVGCKKLRVCQIGMAQLPGPDAQQRGSALRTTSAGGSVRGTAAGGQWVEVDTTLGALRTLRLGLCSVHTLVLALPHLEVLDMNGCVELRNLELRCPRLLKAFYQACRSVPAALWEPLLSGCPMLHTLDVQHSSVPPATLAAVRGGWPHLESLFITPAPVAVFEEGDGQGEELLGTGMGF